MSKATIFPTPLLFRLKFGGDVKVKVKVKNELIKRHKTIHSVYTDTEALKQIGYSGPVPFGVDRSSCWRLQRRLG